LKANITHDTVLTLNDFVLHQEIYCKLFKPNTLVKVIHLKLVIVQSC